LERQESTEDRSQPQLISCELQHATANGMQRRAEICALQFGR
jgi:hypothetical protein